jgi:hypothetical protein
MLLLQSVLRLLRAPALSACLDGGRAKRDGAKGGLSCSSIEHTHTHTPHHTHGDESIDRSLWLLSHAWKLLGGFGLETRNAAGASSNQPGFGPPPHITHLQHTKADDDECRSELLLFAAYV